MTITEANPDEFTPDQERTTSEVVCGLIKLALVVAAIAGAFALMSGWLGEIAIDDLLSALGGSR